VSWEWSTKEHRKRTLAKDACVTPPFWNKTLDARGVAAHPEISSLLAKSIFEFVNAIEDRIEGPGLL
jgi:hypothetical protein